MKLTMIILITTIIHVSASSFAQKITINQKNTTLDKVFKEIRQQTGYDFLFDSQIIKKDKLVNVQVTNVDIDDALKACLVGQPLTYVITERTVVIKEKGFLDRIKDKLFSKGEITITGRVVNLSGEPLAGTVVMLKRTKIAMTVDQNGYFIFKTELLATDTLVCSYIGYKTQYIGIGKKLYFDIRLLETTNSLDEIVVQAYGQTTQRLTTGNIGRLSAAEIAKQPVMNPLLALEGKIAGVVITPQTGYDSGPIKVEIRGRGSINPAFTSDPLYIVDGVPLTVLDIGGTYRTAYSSNANSRGYDQTGMSMSGGLSPIFNINPIDIESIEVLKDADATAIYGSRGANGVILINTKRGKAGKTQLDVNVTQGLRNATKQWELLDIDQYLNARREAFRNDGIVPTIANAPDLTVWDQKQNTNWQDYAYGRTGKWTNLQASVSGGNEQTTFRMGGGFNKTSDITTAKGINQRGSVTVNINNRSLNKLFGINFNASYAFTEVNQIGISGIANLAPNAPQAFDNDGNLNYNGWAAARSSFPFASLLRPYNSKGNNLSANLGLNYLITSKLSIKTNFGYNMGGNEQTSFNPIASQDPASVTNPTGTASFGTNKNNNWVIEPQIEYNGYIGKGKLNALAGGTVQSATTGASLVNGSGFTSDALLRTINNAPIKDATYSYGQYKYTGVFARLGYNWENKYIVNLNGRHDGSSRFGPGNQFGNFGSLGVAWIVSDEPLVRRILPKAISFIKLRGSYGLTGSDAAGDYQYLSQYGTGTGLLAYNGVIPLVPLIQPNDDFHWQVNKKLEAALNVSFLEDRINLEVAFYRNRCDNQLVQFPTSEFTGFSSVLLNSPANVENKGYEFSLNARVIDIKNFSWTTNFNIGVNKNTLLSYPNIQQSPYYNKYRVGQSIDLRYLFNYTGVDPLTGQYTYTDYNGDGNVSANESVLSGTQNDDRYVSVSLAPKYSGGMSHQFTYKSFVLSANFTFRKQMGSNAISVNGGASNFSLYQYENRWQYPGQIALSARLTNTPSSSDSHIGDSNAGWTDASFIRLQTLAIGYSFPKTLISKIGLKALSFNVNAQNVFVLTKYKGIDPEITNFPSLPPVKTITTGLTCSF